MRICCDENIKRSVTELLVQEGYDVVRVQDELDLAFDDGEIISFCRETDRLVLITVGFRAVVPSTSCSP